MSKEPIATPDVRAGAAAGSPADARGRAEARLPATAAEVAALAASIYPEGPVLMRLLQRWRPYICPFEALLPLVPTGATVLDVGCGGGLFLGLLARAGRLGAGLGFDTSVPAIEIASAVAARLEAAGYAGDLRFERRAVEEPWPDGPFDIVSMIDVMHHIHPSAQREAFGYAAERVAVGGCFLYKDMCSRPRWRALANRGHDLVLARQWIHYASIADVEKWAAEEGLRSVDTRTINRLWYGHELRVFERVAVA